MEVLAVEKYVKNFTGNNHNGKETQQYAKLRKQKYEKKLAQMQGKKSIRFISNFNHSSDSTNSNDEE
jgi:hypothetical protein